MERALTLKGAAISDIKLHLSSGARRRQALSSATWSPQVSNTEIVLDSETFHSSEFSA
jgi:hypothetical protein